MLAEMICRGSVGGGTPPKGMLEGSRLPVVAAELPTLPPLSVEQGIALYCAAVYPVSHPAAGRFLLKKLKAFASSFVGPVLSCQL